MIEKKFNKESVALVYITLLTIVSLVYSFTIIPSPSLEHDRSLDHKRVSDLGELQTTIDNEYQTNSALPQTLDELSSNSYDNTSQLNKVDPQTNQPYEYTVTSSTTYQLCATFATDSSKEDASEAYDNTNYNYASFKNKFKHPAGHYCFNETENTPGSDGSNNDISPSPSLDQNPSPALYNQDQTAPTPTTYAYPSVSPTQ